MPFKYIVQCWIYPKSGFDIAKKSRVLAFFRSVMEETFVNGEKIEETIKNFEKMHEGLILEPLMIESDTEIENPVKEILPEIQKTYPEALIFSCDKIPEIVVTENT